MFRLLFVVVFAVAAADAHFLHKLHQKFVTYDINGFKGHHSDMAGMFENNNRPYGHPPPPPPPSHPSPVYGPPPPSPIYGPPHHHTHFMPHYHNHGPDCHHEHHHGPGFPNMMPFNPFHVIPSVSFQLSAGVHPPHPYNPTNSYDRPNTNPNQSNGNIPTQHTPNYNNFGASNYPSNTPSNYPINPSPTNDVSSPKPLDPNTVFADSNNVPNPTTPGNNFNIYNVNVQSSQGMNTNSFGGSNGAANPSKTNLNGDQNNENNYNDAAGAIAPNYNNGNVNSHAVVPGVNEPEATTSSTQGNNGLIYDIDVRFDKPTDNRTNQKLDTIK